MAGARQEAAQAAEALIPEGRRMNQPLADFTRFAGELADTARTISGRYFRQPLKVEHKSADQPVTIADRETEAALRQLIQKHFPDHGIFGEEYGQQDVGRRHTWVIDPIDGTKSFITGMPLFGTLIALLEHGRPVLGVIDMPVLDERWVGVRGKPTLFNGKESTTRHCEQLSRAVLYTTSTETFRGADAKAYAALSSSVQLRRFGGDCYIYGLLALGFIDLALEAELQPYDYLALVPVIEGAGGCISDWQGKPLDLYSDGRVIAAGTPSLHEQALTLLDRKHS
jgi:histidinol phosphatase-like enzyme (inositol monophosphatase family)